MNMTLTCPTPPHPPHQRSINVTWTCRQHAPPHPTHCGNLGPRGYIYIYIYIYVSEYMCIYNFIYYIEMIGDLFIIVYKYVSVGFRRCLQGFPQFIPVKEALCTMKSAALHVLRSPCFGPGRARRRHWFDVQWHESPRRKCWDWDL